MDDLFSTDRVNLPEGALLFMAPQAPAVQLSIRGEGLAFGPDFSPHHLRTLVDGLPVAVRKDSESGRYYYRPHWVAFTALSDNDHNRSSIRQAAELLARVPMDASAPELGYSRVPFMELLSQGLPPGHCDWENPLTSEEKERLFWNSDAPFQHYWRSLQPAQRQHLMDHHGSQALESALLTRRFLVADLLWDQGVRLDEEAKASGRALLAFSESTFPITPNLAMGHHIVQFKEIHKDLDRALSPELQERFGAHLSSHKSLDNTLTRQGLAMARWLTRLVEDGIDLNARQRTVYKTGASEEVKDKRALELVVETATRYWKQASAPMSQHLFGEIARALTQHGFDLKASIDHQNQPMNFFQWLESTGMLSGSEVAALKAETLEHSWTQGPRSIPKPRF